MRGADHGRANAFDAAGERQIERRQTTPDGGAEELAEVAVIGLAFVVDVFADAAREADLLQVAVVLQGADDHQVAGQGRQRAAAQRFEQQVAELLGDRRFLIVADDGADGDVVAAGGGDGTARLLDADDAVHVVPRDEPAPTLMAMVS